MENSAAKQFVDSMNCALEVTLCKKIHLGYRVLPGANID